MGPFGRNVLIEDNINGIKNTKDGVSVARAIKTLEDPIDRIS